MINYYMKKQNKGGETMKKIDNIVTTLFYLLGAVVGVVVGVCISFIFKN